MRIPLDQLSAVAATAGGPPPAEPTPSEGRLLTVAEAQARIGAEAEWLVDGMLAVGDMSLWVAKPGVGKSALLRQLARAVSIGAPFLGHDATPGQVVYLALEGARATLAHLIRLGHDPASDRILVYIDEVEGGRPPAEWLREKLAAITPALIIVDCLGDFARIDERANNAGYGAIYLALGPVLQYAQNQRTHIALIHHAGKRVDQAGIDAALGSTGITGKPGTVFNYRLSDPEDRQSPRILSCSKHRAGDSSDLPDVALGWDPESQTVSIAGLAERLALAAVGIRMIQTVLRQPGITQQALLAEVSGRRGAKIEAFGALRAERIVIRSGNGGRSEPFTVALNPTVADPMSAWRDHLGRIEVPEVPGVPVSACESMRFPGGPKTAETPKSREPHEVGAKLAFHQVPEPQEPHEVQRFPGPVPIGGTTSSPDGHFQDSVPAVPTPIEPGTGTESELDPDGMFKRWRARAEKSLP